ncbi:MAG: PAS domain S-box protein, partial [Myxococcales bacterium]|nr:PAS domain S-box protein [Myxococcales bacterium]
IRDRDDHWHWIDVTARGYRSQSGRRRAVLLGRDVTDRRLAERERRQLTALMEHGSDLMALASLEGEILYVNTAGRELLGVAEGEAPARLDGFFAGADGTPEPALRARIEPVLARSGRWVGHLTLLPRTGAAPIPVLASFVLLSDELPGHGAAIALVCRDEREVLETRHAFREAARRLDLIERGAHYVIAELDRDGRIVYASPNSARVIGLERDALLGRDAFELLPDDARATARVVFERVLAEGAAELGRTSCIDGEGRRRPVEAAIAPATDIDGRPRAVLVVRDLSAEERTAQQLRESEEHLRQAQKMEAVGQLAGGIAHDFNNLLTAITGHADLLLGDLGDDHPSAQDAREVLHAANRAAGLTRQLLAFSRRQVLESRPVDLNALVSQLDRMLRRVVGEHYAFVTQLDGSLWPVVADPGQLEQVLLNLVVNARDAMPGGGAITIRTENLTIANALETCAGDAPPGDYATLCVVDQGTGIEPETAARIFEPFFTTKRPGEGTGLGLSTVLGIVEQSGGHLVLDSAPGLGACFTILLPRATAEVAEPEAAVPTVAERGEGTVLVIEDEAAVRALLVRHLSEHGYDVIEATDGDGALELCRRAARVDLVLSDVVLPSYDGPTIAERVREAFPGAAIAYISGFPDAALERRGLAAADVDLLAKPFSRADLLAFVDRVLAAHRARAAAPKEPLKPA